MSDFRRLNHTKWGCTYHTVFIPKYQRKVLNGKVRRSLGEMFHELAKRREGQILEGHLRPDHVHTHDGSNSAEVVGFQSRWVHQRQKCDSCGSRFQGSGSELRRLPLVDEGVFRVHSGADERTIREYIHHQEENNQKLDQQRFFSHQKRPQPPGLPL